MSAPGKALEAEISARGLTAYSVAAAGKIKASALHEIMDGTRAITARTALILELVLPGRSARDWMQLQTDHQIELTRIAITHQLAALKPARLKRSLRNNETT